MNNLHQQWPKVLLVLNTHLRPVQSRFSRRCQDIRVLKPLPQVVSGRQRVYKPLPVADSVVPGDNQPDPGCLVRHSLQTLPVNPSEWRSPQSPALDELVALDPVSNRAHRLLLPPRRINCYGRYPHAKNNRKNRHNKRKNLFSDPGQWSVQGSCAELGAPFALWLRTASSRPYLTTVDSEHVTWWIPPCSFHTWISVHFTLIHPHYLSGPPPIVFLLFSCHTYKHVYFMSHKYIDFI